VCLIDKSYQQSRASNTHGTFITGPKCEFSAPKNPEESQFDHLAAAAHDVAVGSTTLRCAAPIPTDLPNVSIIRIPVQPHAQKLFRL
jgi:hypothetical protein